MDRRDLDKTITEHADADCFLVNRNAISEIYSRFRQGLHKGVVGIVASRLIEKYYRPTIVLTESNGKVTGSARSVKDFDVYEAIEACSELLLQFGGHKYAAGLTMESENVNAFVLRFEEEVSLRITEEQLIPEIEIDLEIPFEKIDNSFYSVLKQFAPFGPGNMRPFFSHAKSAIVDGENSREKHLKLD